MIRAVAVALLLLAAACSDDGDDDGGDEGAGGDEQLLGRAFLSHDVEGQVLVDGTQVRLEFGADGALRASAGCNTMGMPLVVENGRVQPAAVDSTEIGCDPARHAQDAWIAALLAAGPNLVLDGDELLVTAGDVTLLLTDERA